MSGGGVKLLFRSFVCAQKNTFQGRTATPDYCFAACKAARRVLTFSSLDRLPTSSGPVQYVPKLQPNQGPDCGRTGSPYETGDAYFGGSVQNGSSEMESHGESNTNPKRATSKTSKQPRGKGQTSYVDPATLSFEPSANRSKSKTKEMAEEASLDVNGPELDTEDTQPIPGVCSLNLYPVSSPGTFSTHIEEFGAEKSRRRTSNDDPSTSARNYAITLLARGLLTESSLRSKLMRKNLPQQLIDETINHLQKCGLQSDEEYAEVFARSRWKANTWGPTRIKFALLKKGINKETAEIAIVNLFQRSDKIGGSQDEDGDLARWGMTAEAAEHLLCQARRRWSQGDMEFEVRRRRMIGWLQRRGFSWTDISDILKTIVSK